MASFPKDTEKAVNIPKENDILKAIDNMMSTMQQLQSTLVTHLSSNTDRCVAEFQKNEGIKAQNPAVLLKEIQDAMQSTIDKLSASEEIYKVGKVDEAQEEEEAEASNTKMTVSEKWRIYTELVQKKYQNTKEYCMEKMRLGQELGLSFKETRREMLIGLWSTRMSMILYLKDHNNMADLLQDLQEFEKFENARSDTFKKYRLRNK